MHVNNIDMETKLTLRLNDSVIEKAKSFAKSQGISLSKMIESYLDYLTSDEKPTATKSVTPLVESLSGVINLSSDFDYKDEYADYLTKKYK